MKTVCKKLFSLLLVAVLLVSAIPFQAFATGELIAYFKDVNGNAITHGGVTSEQTLGERYGAEIDGLAAQVGQKTGYTFANKWQANGAGAYTVDQVKAMKLSADTTFTPVFTANTYILTLDAGEGTINNGDSSANRNVTYDAAVGELPVAAKANNTFVGWFDADGNKLTSNTTWKIARDETYFAKFEENRNALTISGVKMVDGVQKETTTVGSDSVMENELLLDYLNTNWKNQIAVPTGYSWDRMWYKNAASQPLETQDTVLSANRAVFVKFTANSYTLSFDPGTNGKVDPTSKTVYYDKAIGTLPTPTSDKLVFSHWVDQSGNRVTADTVYKTAGNSKLTAVWKNEVKINLHMHTEKSKTGGIIAPLSGYVAGNDITQTIAMNVVKQYYNGDMTFAGLFNDSDWAQYVEGKNPTGKNFVKIPEGVDSYTIHVMINNGTLGNSPTTEPTTGSNNSTGSTNGTQATEPTKKPADPTNPTTGDTSMIYTTMTVMLIAAAALVVVMQLRKRKMI